MIISALFVMSCIGSHFVGMKWCKIVVLGIVMIVENVETGESGTVIIVIVALME